MAILSQGKNEFTNFCNKKKNAGLMQGFAQIHTLKHPLWD